VDVLRRAQVLQAVALAQLPEHDPFRTMDLTSCAVVGSAAGLKGGGAGNAIDAHTAVFRFNEAPTKSYEKDVGAYGLSTPAASRSRQPPRTILFCWHLGECICQEFAEWNPAEILTTAGVPGHQGPRPHCVSRTRSVRAAARSRASCVSCVATAY
jgi:hypothetical protein